MHRLGASPTAHALACLSFGRRAICARVSKTWSVAAQSVPFPRLLVVAFAEDRLRRCFQKAENAVLLGRFIEWWMRKGAPLPFPMRFVTRLSVFESDFSAFQLSALSQAMVHMPLLHSVHVLAGRGHKDNGALAELAWAADGFLPSSVRSLHFMSGYLTWQDAAFARHIAMFVLAHRDVRDVTVHVKVWQPQENVVWWVGELSRAFQEQRGLCVNRMGPLYADAAGWPAPLGHLLAAYACAHRPLPASPHPSSVHADDAPQLTLAFYSEGHCLPDDLVLELGDVLVAAKKQRVAVMRLDVTCGNGSCYDREADLSARLAGRRVPHTWTRRGTCDAFRLWPLMPHDKYSGFGNTDTLPTSANWW